MTASMIATWQGPGGAWQVLLPAENPARPPVSLSRPGQDQVGVLPSTASSMALSDAGWWSFQ